MLPAIRLCLEVSQTEEITMLALLERCEARTCGGERAWSVGSVHWSGMSGSRLIQLPRGFTLGCQTKGAIRLAVGSRSRDLAGLGRNNTWCWMSEMGSGQ